MGQNRTPTVVSRRTAVRLLLAAGIWGGSSTSLIACGASAPAAPSVATPQTPKPASAPAPTEVPKPAAVATQAPGKAANVTINIWTHYAAKLGEEFAAHCGRFMKANPDIEIKITTVPMDEMLPKILAAIAAGAPPDTYTSAAMIRPELVKANAIEPLDRFGKPPEDRYKVNDPLTIFDGAWYGVPELCGLWALFYNEDLYKKVGLDPDKPPATWDDIVTHAKKLTDSSQNQYGIVLPNKPFPWTVEVWSGFLMQAGGEFLSPDNKEAAFNSQAGVDALQFWVDLHHTHKVAPLAQFDNNSTMTTYGTGKIGMLATYSARTTTIASYAHKSRTTPAPMKVRRATHFAGGYMPMMAGGKNKEAVWRFFDWAMQPESNARWTAGIGAIPIRKSATDHPVYQEFMKSQPMVKAFVDSLEFARALPMVLGLTEVEQVVSEAIEACVYQRAKPKEALDAAAKKANEILKKANS